MPDADESGMLAPFFEMIAPHFSMIFSAFGGLSSHELAPPKAFAPSVNSSLAPLKIARVLPVLSQTISCVFIRVHKTI